MDATDRLAGAFANATMTLVLRIGAVVCCAGSIVFADEVLASGSAPVFISVPGNQTRPEDLPLWSLGVLLADAEGDTLTLSAVSDDQTLIPDSSLVVSPASGGPGTYSRGISITPSSNRHGGPVLITLTLFDGTTAVQAAFSVTVTEVNDTPLVADDALTAVAEDSGERVVAAATLLANDSAGPLETEQDISITAVGNAVGGAVSLRDSTIAFTPTANFNGTAGFRYTASDDGTTNGAAAPLSGSALVTFAVSALDDDPVANDDIVGTAEDRSSSTHAVANDIDVDSDALVVAAVTQGASGTVTFAAGNVTYTPNPDFHGVDAFGYTVSDGSGPTDSAAVSVTVSEVNDPTTAVDDMLPPMAEDAGNRTVPFALLLGNDLAGPPSESDQTLALTAVGSAAGGTVSLVGTDVVFVPTLNFNGVATFAYTATDDGTTNGTTAPLSDAAVVTFAITPVNDPPVANDDLMSTPEDTPRSVHVVANDTDIDGDPLSITAVTQGIHGAVTFAGGSVTYTPYVDFNGTDAFVCTVSDGNGGTDVQTVQVIVTEVNDGTTAVDDMLAPVAEDAGDLAIPFTTLLGNDRPGPADESGQLLTITAAGTAVGGTVDVVGTSVVFSPTPNFNGAASFSYTATDNGTTNGAAFPQSDTASVMFAITPVNDPPVANADIAAAVEDSQTGPIAVLRNDIDVEGSVLSVVGVTDGANGSVVNNGTNVSYTPGAHFFGADTFSYTVDDGAGGTDTGTVTVTVGEVNDAPVAVDDALASLAEDTGRTIELSALTANDLAGPANESGQALTVAAVGSAVGGAISIMGTEAVFSPAPDFNGMAGFAYTLGDAGTTGGTPAPLTDIGAVTFAVTAVNDAPDAVNDTLGSVAEDSGDRTIPFATLLGNDTTGPANEAGQALAVSAAGSAIGGAVYIVGTNVIFAPAPDFNGTAGFSYTATDNGSTNAAPSPMSDAATAAFAITAVNDAPVANDDTLTVAEDARDTVDVLADDTDVEADPLLVSAVTQGAHGTVTHAAGSVTYAPNADFNGSDAFSYTVSDGNGGIDTGAVAVTVAAVNDAPLADADGYAPSEDVPLTVASPGVLDGDTDVDSAVLEALLVSNVSHGTLSLGANGGFSYTPDPDFNGTDAFTYRASDGARTSDPATVTLAVAAVNDAPTADADSYSMAEDAELTIAGPGVLEGDADLDSAMLTAVLVASTANGTLSLSSDGGFGYTPNQNFNGTDAFIYRASDGALVSNSATVTITVTAGNDAPVANDAAPSTLEDTPRSPHVVANDVDVDGDALIVSAVTQPANGTVGFAGGSVTYTPSLNFFGADSFDYTLSDGNGGTDVGTVIVTVTPVDDAPIATPQLLATSEEVPLSITLAGTDPEGSPLTYAVAIAPIHGVLGGMPPQVTYTPHVDFFGSDSFAFVASDPALTSAPGVVQIDVAGVNDRPGFANLGALAHAAGSEGPRSVPGWAHSVVMGPPNESTQVVLAYAAAQVSDPGDAIGAIAVANDGTLAYTLTGATGLAEFEVVLRDDGGTAHGGADSSPPARLLIGSGIEADLSVTKSDGVTTVEEQQPIVYTIVAANAGTSGVLGARVIDPMPPDLAAVTWSCVASAGSSCPASGTDDIDVGVDLPAGGRATFTVTGVAQGAIDDLLGNAVFVTLPPAVFDPDIGNNEATDSDLALLSADGFEDSEQPAR